MSVRCFYRISLVPALLLMVMPTVHAGATHHPGKAVTSRHRGTSWSRIDLHHVSPQYILKALQQGREWRSLLHGTRGRLLEGIALVIPSSRGDALFARGTRAGVQTLRQIVGLLDTPVRAVSSAKPPETVNQAYQMALRGEWGRSINAARSVLSRSPENAEAAALQAYSLIKSDEPDNAEALVSRAIQQTEGATGRARALALVAEGTLADARGNKAKAVSAFQNAGNADESCALAYLAFSDYAHRNGKDDTARKLLQGGLAAVKTPAERAVIRARLGVP